MTFIDSDDNGRKVEKSDPIGETLAPKPVLSEYHRKKNNLPEAANRFARDELFGRWTRKEVESEQ